MGWQKERGIVLGSVRHNDRTVIAHLFTEGCGRVPYVFYLSSGGKNVARNTLLQPLTILEFENRIVPTASLQHIKDPVNLAPFSDIPFNPVKSSIALFIGEFLSYALREEGENRPLFRFLTDSICEFDTSRHTDNFHLYLMLRIAAFLGICPNADEYEPGSWLDMRAGVFVPAQPSHPDYIEPEDAYRIAALLQCDSTGQAASIPMTGASRSAILLALNGYYRLHVPEFPVLKSIDILQTVFSNLQKITW